MGKKSKNIKEIEKQQQIIQKWYDKKIILGLTWKRIGIGAIIAVFVIFLLLLL